MSDRERPDRRWCGGRPVLASEAMEDWVVLLRACHPWNEMLLDDVTGEFRGVLAELLHATKGASPELRAARLRRVAREHGAFRRRQGCSAAVLAEEVAFAEEAIAAALVRGGAGAAVAAAFQDSLAPVMRGVARAAYSGYVDLKP